jgi:hypothetical protein
MPSPNDRDGNGGHGVDGIAVREMTFSFSVEHMD